MIEQVKFIAELKDKKMGLMSREQYLRIASRLSYRGPLNLLVFGLGEDSYVWAESNKGGKTVFLEDDAEWITQFADGDLDIRKVEYHTKAKNYKKIGFDESQLKMDLPEDVMNQKWDFIIVDAPLGHNPPRPFKGPGRMSSIYMASQLIADGGDVYVDDFGRDIEKEYSYHYFGQENLVNVCQDKLAFFHIPEIKKNFNGKSRGVIYICHGQKYIDEGIISAQSVKLFCPNLHITMFADQKVKSPFIDDVKIIKPRSIRAKVYTIYDSPYDETIFLDTDIVADYKFDEVFDLLGKYDIALAHDLARKREKYSNVMPEYKVIPYAFPEVNTGVIVFKKCEEVETLFSLWKKYHNKYYRVCNYDQPSFRISLWESEANLYVLPVEYNVRSKQNRAKQDKFHDEFGAEHMQARIYHMHHSQAKLSRAIRYCRENHQPF